MTEQPHAPEIYPMPAFPTLETRDIEASARFYVDVLGFQHIYSLPGPGGVPIVVHVRWAQYADLLLRRPMGVPAEGPKGVGISLSFAVFEGKVDDVAERARRAGVALVTEPKNQPWNARDFSLRDPDGFLLTFTQGPVEKDFTMDRLEARAQGTERP
jgi:catechol 2,3-dioxygenase-like lactoylglutathione lyase family enzyme